MKPKMMTRPNAVADSEAFKLWVGWCHPWVYQEWLHWSGPEPQSLWYWAEMRHPDILGAFKKLTWEV